MLDTQKTFFDDRSAQQTGYQVKVAACGEQVRCTSEQLCGDYSTSSQIFGEKLQTNEDPYTAKIEKLIIDLKQSIQKKVLALSPLAQNVLDYKENKGAWQDHKYVTPTDYHTRNSELSLIKIAEIHSIWKG